MKKQKQKNWWNFCEIPGVIYGKFLKVIVYHNFDTFRKVHQSIILKKKSWEIAEDIFKWFVGVMCRCSSLKNFLETSFFF